MASFNSILFAALLAFSVTFANALTSDSGLYLERPDQYEMLCDTAKGQCLCGYTVCPVEQMDCSNGYCRCSVSKESRQCDGLQFRAQCDFQWGAECECGVSRCSKDHASCSFLTGKCSCPDVYCPAAGLQSVAPSTTASEVFLSKTAAAETYTCNGNSCTCGATTCNTYEFSLQGGVCECAAGRGTFFEPTTAETRNAWSAVLGDVSIFETVAQGVRDVTSLVARRMGMDA